MTRRETFEQDGFVAVPNFCGAEQLAGIEDALRRFMSRRLIELPSEHVFFEDTTDPSTLKQIQRLHNHDEFFGAFMAGAPRRLAEELLGEPVVGKNLQYFNKPPAIGQATPPHQDGFYFMLEPCRALTMWMALDVVDAENGCVRYVRGSHTRGMRPHGRTETLGFSQGIIDFGQPVDSENEVACPAQPGDLLVHQALTIHRADANASATRNRRALGFIFYAESARENVAAHEAYQAELATELAAAGKI
ncbi:MAG TPA: phytanoyl-CoA dioxygenase [Verrucomicrobiales bacterium]|nr:phytanoyl-CoA dioxygenase [Verrucomicrobiales bacterium]